MEFVSYTKEIMKYFEKITVLLPVVLLSNLVQIIGMDAPPVVRTTSSRERATERTRFIEEIQKLLDSVELVSLAPQRKGIKGILERIRGTQEKFYLDGDKASVTKYCDVYTFIKNSFEAAKRNYEYSISHLRLMLRLGYIPIPKDLKDQWAAQPTFDDFCEILGRWGSGTRLGDIVEPLRLSRRCKDAIEEILQSVDLAEKNTLIFMQEIEDVKGFLIRATVASLDFYSSCRNLLMLVNRHLKDMHQSYEDAAKIELKRSFSFLIEVPA